ncbi:MAG: hypothetical protein JSR86_13930 [Proteobacteria bacterium]|nr:hypothetical protein [Pseudomonadota bacterium]
MDRMRMANVGNAVAALVGGAALMWWPGFVWHGGGQIGPSHGDRILAATVSTALGIAWIAVFMVRIFRRQDEFFRQGAKFAWFWGGPMGLMATMPAYIFIALGGLTWLWPQTPSGPGLARAFVYGYALAYIGPTLGVTTAGLVWRLRNR